MSAEFPSLYELEKQMENKEIGEPVDYEVYRAFCDVSNDTFRRLGILDAESYEAALRDKRTVMCNMLGRTFPAMVPIEYESRYDAERTKKMTGSDQVMLLTIPADCLKEANFYLPQILEGQAERGEFALLVEQLHEDEEVNRASRKELAQQLSLFGRMQAYDFIDERLEGVPENENAWMGIYDFSFTSQREIPESMYELRPIDAIVTAWEEYRHEKKMPKEPAPNSNETYLFTSAQLLNNPEMVKALWGISEVGFGKVLGMHHPISMEVTKSFFEEHVTSDDVLTAVRFADGEPVCFGFLAPNMNYNDWLDCEATALKAELDDAEENGEQIAHFFELISKGEAGVALSTGIIKTFLEVASRSRPKWRILFESTNLSDTYIPKIAERLIDRSQSVAIAQPVDKIAQLDYWYLKAS